MSTPHHRTCCKRQTQTPPKAVFFPYVHKGANFVAVLYPFGYFRFISAILIFNCLHQHFFDTYIRSAIIDSFSFLVVLLTACMSRQQNNSQLYKSLHYSDYETFPHTTPGGVVPEMTKHFCDLPGAISENVIESHGE